MLYTYVSSVLIYGCETWESLCYESTYWLPGHEKMFPQKYPIYPVLKLNVVGIQSMYKENLQFVQHI